MILEFKNINKSFGAKKVLNDISFTAESGSALGLLGRNGAGKTTSIRILMGVFPSDTGEILVDGNPIDRSKITFGYLPEERGLYGKRKIIDQLVYFAMLKGLSREDATKACDYWLSRLDMAEYRNQNLDTLSKGNQQKIQLITAVSHNPDIIVLDEPFSGLDPVNAMLLKDVVNEQIQSGKIVLFSSHQMNYIEEFCDSIAIINKGRIAVAGNINEIKHSYPRTKLYVRGSGREQFERTLHFSSDEEKQSLIKEYAATCDLDEIKVVEPTLNDIFVEYAGDDSNERRDA